MDMTDGIFSTKVLESSTVEQQLNKGGDGKDYRPIPPQQPEHYQPIHRPHPEHYRALPITPNHPSHIVSIVEHGGALGRTLCRTSTHSRHPGHLDISQHSGIGIYSETGISKGKKLSGLFDVRLKSVHTFNQLDMRLQPPSNLNSILDYPSIAPLEALSEPSQTNTNVQLNSSTNGQNISNNPLNSSEHPSESSELSSERSELYPEHSGRSSERCMKVQLEALKVVWSALEGSAGCVLSVRTSSEEAGCGQFCVQFEASPQTFTLISQLKLEGVLCPNLWSFLEESPAVRSLWTESRPSQECVLFCVPSGEGLWTFSCENKLKRTDALCPNLCPIQSNPHCVQLYSQGEALDPAVSISIVPMYAWMKLGIIGKDC